MWRRQPACRSVVGRMYGEPIFDLPKDLYIPPDALEVILEAFEGPLDLLLYLIRKANINVLDIPMVPLTAQYLEYVEAMRHHNLELAADYLLMAATLLEIKSRMLLPRPPRADEAEELDPGPSLSVVCLSMNRSSGPPRGSTSCRGSSGILNGSGCSSPRRWSSASPP
jgi:segregation and condensation protein A